MALLRVGVLPDAPLAAAAQFHGAVLPKVEAMLAGMRDSTPLPYREGAGGGGVPQAPITVATPHSNPSPEEEGLVAPALSLTLIFPAADHTHRGWRLAAVQGLARARARAPLRINAIASDDEAAIVATEAWLAQAPGVTGQLLILDGHGTGVVLASPA